MRQVFILAIAVILTGCGLTMTSTANLQDLEKRADTNERLYRDCVDAYEKAALETKVDSIVLVGQPLEFIDSFIEGDTVYITKQVTIRDTLRVTEEKTKIVKVADPMTQNNNEMLIKENEQIKDERTKDIVLFSAVFAILGFVIGYKVSRTGR